MTTGSPTATSAQPAATRPRLSEPPRSRELTPSLSLVIRAGQPTCTCGRRLGVGLGPAEHLAGDRGDLAVPEQQEAQEVRGRVAFGPLEVDVRAPPVTSRICRTSAARAFGTDDASIVITR